MAGNKKAIKLKKLYFWIINLMYPQNHLLQVRLGLKCFISAVCISLSQAKKITKLTFVPQSLPTDIISYYVTKAKCNTSTSNQDTSVDINRVILVPERVIKYCQLKNYQWISLVPLSTSSTPPKCNFLCQIVTLEDSAVEKYANCQYLKENISCVQNTTAVFMTPTALHNLKGDTPFAIKINRSTNTLYSVRLPLVKPAVSVPVTRQCGYGIIFKKAKTVRLARLSSTDNIDLNSNANVNNQNVKNVDRILHKYFEDNKYVSVGDIIPISVKTSLGRGSNESGSVVYFQVTRIETEEEGSGNGNRNQVSGDEIDTTTAMYLYCISVSTTSLYLNESQIINSSHPSTDKLAILQCPSVSCPQEVDVVPIYSPPLENYINSLSEWLESFIALRSSLNIQGDRSHETSELWPTALITGIVGCGKYTICRTLAQKHGLNFYCVNMAFLIGDTSAFTIAKLSAIIHKAEAYSPCILFIKNIHLLGKDKEGQEDKRVILSFTDLLRDINRKSYGSDSSRTDTGDGETFALPSQIFVVGSTHETEQITPVLQDCFIHTSNVEPFRNGDQIVQALEWLLKVEVEFEQKHNLEGPYCLLVQSSREILLSQNFDLRNWVETKNVKSVIKYWGDVRALLAIAIRKAVGCAIVAGSTSNVKELDGNLGNSHGPTYPLFMASTTSDCCMSWNVLDETHFTDALDSLEVEIRSSVGSPKVPQVSWDDIGGLSNIKSELINSVQLPLKYPQLFTSGLKRSGILLYGPPGTGKTLVAKAVASEFKINFLSVKGPELLNMYVGQSEKNVREVFDRARDCAPCVLFFDELDSLAPNRGRSGDSGGVMDRVVSQILAEMDGTHSTPGVFIIGATNRPDLIDPALLRPGRFDKLLYVGVCAEKEGISSILKALTRKFNLSGDVDLEKLAEKLPIGMSGADIYSFCSESFMIAITKRIEMLENGDSTDQESAIQVCQEDFCKALERISTSLSKAEVSKYEEMKALMR